MTNFEFQQYFHNKCNNVQLVSDAEQPYEIPEGWIWVSLGSIGDYYNGRAFKQNEWTNEGRPIIRIQDLTGTNNNPNYYNGPVDPRHAVEPGDLLISWSATLGAFIWNGPSAVLNQHIFKVNSFIDKKYHYYVVQHFINELYSKTHGSGMVHVTKGIFDATPVPLPPLADQKRIVERIESLLGKIKSVKLICEESVEFFNTRRSNIIKRAFQGLLTKSWRKSKGDEAIILTENAPFALPNSWRWARAEEVFLDKPRNGYSPQSTEAITSTKTLKLGSITKGYFKNDEFKYIEENIPHDSYLWLKKGDFLIQRANSIEYVGISAIYSGEDKEFIYPDLIMKAKINEEVINPQFFSWWVNSEYGRAYFVNNATGTAGNMPKINQKVVLGLPVPIPSIAEQKVIMKILSKALHLEGLAYKNVTDVDKKINEIFKSILSKAFSGDLATIE